MRLRSGNVQTTTWSALSGCRLPTTAGVPQKKQSAFQLNEHADLSFLAGDSCLNCDASAASEDMRFGFV